MSGNMERACESSLLELFISANSDTIDAPCSLEIEIRSEEQKNETDFLAKLYDEESPDDKQRATNDEDLGTLKINPAGVERVQEFPSMLQVATREEVETNPLLTGVDDRNDELAAGDHTNHTPNRVDDNAAAVTRGIRVNTIHEALAKVVSVLKHSSCLLLKLRFSRGMKLDASTNSGYSQSQSTLRQASATVVNILSESALFTVDRLRSLSDVYIHPHITMDHPEAQHLLWLVSYYLSRGDSTAYSDTRGGGLLRDLRASAGASLFPLVSEVAGDRSRDGNNPYIPSLESFSLRQLQLLRFCPPPPAAMEGEKLGVGDSPRSHVLKTNAPPFKENKFCFCCRRFFGIAIFRHHCRRCGESFCSVHSADRRRLPKLGFASCVRVCISCARDVDAQIHADQLWWRDVRVSHFLLGSLVLYSNSSVDRKIDKALRVVEGSLTVVKRTISLDYPSKIVIETIMALKRYGLSGLAGVLMREDFFEAVESLKKISGMDKMFAMSLHELTACIYYKLAIDRGLRGCNPDAEFETAESCKENNSNNNYNDNGGGVRVHLDEAIRFAPLALDAIYQESEVECQRIAQLQGWTSIFIHTESAPEEPAYALFGSSAKCDENNMSSSSSQSSSANNTSTNSADYNNINNNNCNHNNHKRKEDSGNKKEEKVAILAIRGTVSVHDVVTDIRAAPIRFPPPKRIISEALQGVYHNQSDDVLNVPVNGRVVVADNDISPSDCAIDISSNNSNNHGGGGISGIDNLSSTNCVTEAALSSDDDFLTIKLSQWEWTSEMRDMRYACRGMARSALWLLRQVGPALLRLSREGYELILTGHSLGAAVAVLMVALLKEAVPSVRAVVYGCPSCVDAFTADSLKDSVLSVVLHDDVVSRVTPHSLRGLLKELMLFRHDVFRHVSQDWSDVIARAKGLWAPRLRQSSSSDLFHGSESGRAVLGTGNGNGNGDLSSSSPSILLPVSVPPEGDAGDSLDSQQQKQQRDPQNATSATDHSSLVLVDDEKIPELWLPGKLMHIYSYRGQYRAVMVSRDYPCFRRIEVQGNMFADHATTDIFDALLEARSVDAKDITPGPWTKYDAVSSCECCQNNFTWHSTFRGEAQQYRERYNCRQCGRLVCGPCSEKRRPVPQLGLLFPSRVCDACYYKADYV